MKSTRIEGTQISQDEMYYLKYMPKTDETNEIQNLKKVIEYSKNFLNDNDNLDIKKLNNIHKILFSMYYWAMQ